MQMFVYIGGGDLSHTLHLSLWKVIVVFDWF